jgi:hypothetical protein
VVTTAVEKPRGVAIHVAKKLLVFTDWGARPQVNGSLDISNIIFLHPGSRVERFPDQGSVSKNLNILTPKKNLFPSSRKI